MSGADDAAFDVTGPLPTGKLAIEASAGTGKTYALAALAVRFIAEGAVSASELLVVTFTRAATNELRAKVRERLVEVAGYLASPDPPPTDDALVTRLAARDDPELLERVQRAITEFDAATVTTIHGFAAQVLGALGVSAGADPGARLAADSTGVITEACADVLVGAAAAGCPADLLPRLETLVSATRIADGRPDLALVPTDGQPGATATQLILADLVGASVRAVSDRRRRAGTLSFDDLIVQLRDALGEPGARGAIDALRSRFKVVLIDEFQDTDPVQWEIFSRLFDRGGAGTALVMVGDPKQAIYGFRGADVQTYLRAVGEGSGTVRRSLTTNWRSDGAVIRSLDTLFAGATFGESGIRYTEVHPAPAAATRHLSGAGGEQLPALSVRLAIGDGIARWKSKPHGVVMEAAERAVRADLCDRVRRLLDGGRLPDDQAGRGWRPVRPPDIAVLVRRHTEAAAIQAALVDRGVPAVVARGGSVLESPAADQMRWLLHALGRPSDPGRVRMYALSWFGGLTVAEVASLPDGELVLLQEQLGRWSERLASHPVAEVLAQIWSESDVGSTVLGSPDGDRNMTDLDHLAEWLQASTPTGRSGVAGLLAALDHRAPDEDDTESDDDLAARRIATEADAVQIMTVWTAKGLQFPVVCLPSLWRQPPRDPPIVYLDPETGRRTFDLAQGKDWPDEAAAERRISLARDEMAGEDLRLLYVAFTRAQHQTIVWWSQAEHGGSTALARMLFARRAGRIDPETYGARQVRIPADSDAVPTLRALVERSEGTIEVGVVDGAEPTDDRWSPVSESAPAPALEVAVLDRDPDRSRNRWSFSAIVERAGTSTFDPTDPSLADTGAGDEQAGPAGADGAMPTAGPWPTSPAFPDTGATTGPLALLPAGAAFGTLVHAVLEEVDGTDADLEAQLAATVDRQLERRPLALDPVDGTGPDSGRRLLVDGLAAAIGTPLGPLCGHRRLADIGPGDRVTELAFDFRLADGGTTPVVADLGRTLLSHLRSDDPMRAWARSVADGAIDISLAGHLTGSIDLVMRIDGSPAPRFVVADYKTNALHRLGQPVEPGDYGPGRMAEAMVEHDYPLQAALYSVALHRYLRWRLAGYDPGVHLGGVAYLFLRGMTGPEPGPVVGSPAGVFSWDLPPAAVVELSDVLDGYPVRAAAS